MLKAPCISILTRFSYIAHPVSSTFVTHQFISHTVSPAFSALASTMFTGYTVSTGQDPENKKLSKVNGEEVQDVLLEESPGKKGKIIGSNKNRKSSRPQLPADYVSL